MPLSKLLTDTVLLIKQDGTRVENIKASVQSKKIFIDRSDILIEPSDLIQRKMSNGGEETYQVIDPGFHEKLFNIPAGYQITHKKLGLPESKKVVQNITYNHNIHIAGDNNGIAVSGNKNTIINSQFDEKFIQLIQAVEQSQITNKHEIIQYLEQYKNDKTQLQPYLGNLLTRGAEVSTIISAVGSLIGLL